MARLTPAVVAAAAAVLVVGGAALASGVVGGGSGSGSSAAPAPSASAPATSAPATTAPTGTAAPPATTATAPAATTDPSLPIGDPRRLPAPQPGELAGALLLGTGICVPALVDLASPGPPEQVALHIPGCAVAQSPSGRYLAIATQSEPEGQPLVIYDTRTGRNRTARRVNGGLGTGPPAVGDDGTVGTCEFTGLVIDTPRRLRHRPGTCARVGAHGGLAILQRDRRTLADAITGRRALRLQRPLRGDLPVLAPSRSGRLIAGLAFDVGAAFTYLTLYDRAGRVVTPRQRLTNAIRVREVSLADDGRALALRSDVGWELFNLKTGSRLRQIGASPILSATVSPDGSRFAVVTPQAIVFVDAATMAPQQAIPAFVRSVWWLDRVPPAGLR